MSLKEAYTLAHTAQSRLSLAASRPDRQLRFVVGHLMHYESLRLRIVEIEHEHYLDQRLTNKSSSSSSHIDYTLQCKPSVPPGLGSSPSTTTEAVLLLDDLDDYAEIDDYEDDAGGDDLGLARCPSNNAASASASTTTSTLSSSSSSPPPELESDNSEADDDDDDDYDEDFLIDYSTSTEEPDCEDDTDSVFEDVRNCSCRAPTSPASFQLRRDANKWGVIGDMEKRVIRTTTTTAAA